MATAWSEMDIWQTRRGEMSRTTMEEITSYCNNKSKSIHYLVENWIVSLVPSTSKVLSILACPRLLIQKLVTWKRQDFQTWQHHKTLNHFILFFITAAFSTQKKSGWKHSINLETQTFVLVIFIKISQLGVIWICKSTVPNNKKKSIMKFRVIPFPRRRRTKKKQKQTI